MASALGGDHELNGRSVSRHKRDADATRARILVAAQQAFSTKGYSHSGIRDIAKLAEVSSPLIVRYFGTKAHLFEEAIEISLGQRLAAGISKADYAEFVATVLLDPVDVISLPMMVALASGDTEAAEIAARCMTKHSLTPLAEWLGGEDATERALAIAMVATGYVIYARQLPLPKTMDQAKIVDWFKATLERLVTGSGWIDQPPAQSA
ncbi:MAG: TetR family transcriptional regulator [Novosphingobium sp.]